MDLRRRQLFAFLGLALVGMAGINALVEATGKGVALAIALGMIALLVASYVRIAVIGYRAVGKPDAAERMRRRVLPHMAIMASTPLVIFAAHPWGRASIAVGFGVMVLAQMLYLHVTIIAGFVLKGRARRKAQ